MIDEEPMIPGFNAPDPGEIFQAARSTRSKIPLREYMDAIVELRETKGFSFREIAEWFSKKVAKTDHNAVYREYKKYQKKEQKYEMENGTYEPDPQEEVREEETAED